LAIWKTTPSSSRQARKIGWVEAQVPTDSNCSGALPAVAPSVDSDDRNLEKFSQFLERTTSELAGILIVLPEAWDLFCFCHYRSPDLTVPGANDATDLAAA
jgi:hypothetical protein